MRSDNYGGKFENLQHGGEHGDELQFPWGNVSFSSTLKGIDKDMKHLWEVSTALLKCNVFTKIDESKEEKRKYHGEDFEDMGDYIYDELFNWMNRLLELKKKEDDDELNELEKNKEDVDGLENKDDVGLNDMENKEDVDGLKKKDVVDGLNGLENKEDHDGLEKKNVVDELNELENNDDDELENNDDDELENKEDVDGFENKEDDDELKRKKLLELKWLEVFEEE
ncbi:uncharacterized protein DDB_G0290685-like [Impatiens glandulifera]|uniref:uncharacterized protein DDB_G0290685-like n=1 Tax=Impatiens glandulifera TaxID=253017 RepID=UPI001FB15325|nr:uncharacterized protein DDB_G0290685-like [Impatiens glandulifera]